MGPWSWAPVWSHLPLSPWDRFSATLVHLNFPRASPYLSVTYWVTMLPQGGLMSCRLTLRAGPGVHRPASGCLPAPQHIRQELGRDFSPAQPYGDCIPAGNCSPLGPWEKAMRPPLHKVICLLPK